jgi:hypothetical protein
MVQHADEVRRQAVGTGRDARGENDLAVGGDTFELRTALAATADFKIDTESMVFEDEVRSFTAAGGFQVVDCDASLTCQKRRQCAGQEVFFQRVVRLAAPPEPVGTVEEIILNSEMETADNADNADFLRVTKKYQPTR